MATNNCNQREYMKRSCNSHLQREHGNCSCNLNAQTEHRNYSCASNYELDSLPLAMAYVPWQQFHTVYEVDKALASGTIFPELYKPFLGKRGVHR